MEVEYGLVDAGGYAVPRVPACSTQLRIEDREPEPTRR
jgi:hypothetical protein